jgi:hypothetical protein
MFQLSNISKQDSIILRRYFLENLFSSISLPLSDNATFRVSNFRPTKEGLSDIFFTAVGESYELCRHITESMGVETIHFPSIYAGNAVDANDDSNCVDTSLVDPLDDIDPHSDHHSDHHSDRHSHPYPMTLSDIPLGMRLINSYRNAEKDSIINVKEGTIKVEGPNSNVWRTVDLHEYDSSLSSLASMPAHLPSHSVVDVAQHIGRDELYAVAHYCLLVERPPRAEEIEPVLISMMSGVTILPPGGLWLSLALACAGIENHSIMTYKEKELKSKSKNRERKLIKKNEKIEIKEKKLLCDEVMRHINDSIINDGTVRYNAILVDCVNKIFDKWINK